MTEENAREELLNLYMLEEQLGGQAAAIEQKRVQVRERKRRLLEALAFLEEQRQGTFAKPQVIQGGNFEDVGHGNGDEVS